MTEVAAMDDRRALVRSLLGLHLGVENDAMARELPRNNGWNVNVTAACVLQQIGYGSINDNAIVGEEGVLDHAKRCQWREARPTKTRKLTNKQEVSLSDSDTFTKDPEL